MKNSAKIRTMSDDLKDTESDSAKQNEQQKPASEVSAKKIQQPTTQPAKPSNLQAVRSDMRQQPAKPGDKQSEIKEKTVPKHFDKSSSNESIKSTSDQDNELKKLIKKISDQTDKDSDNKYKTEKEEEITTASQKDIAAKETGIVNELANKNKSESEIKKENISKEIANEPVKKEADDKNTDDIDKLKKLIHRISEPKSKIEEKPENKTGDLESAKEKNTASSTASPLIRKPKENIQQEPLTKKSIKKKEIAASSPSGKPKKSFWKNISEKLKKSSDSEKINALSSKKKISDIKTNDDSKAKEFASQSGILRDNKDTKKKGASQKENLSKKAYYDKSHISPNERLIHGKQKFYSSVSKRIKL
ncbi:hypothetical protein GQ568_00580, partial [Patescibacteria group bacterium]|nr:hypothetical protein [Patescibacteria group bacterium]